MNKKRKYIMIEVVGKYGVDEKTTPILFSDDFIHSSVARGVKSTFSGRSYNVVSAGFYRIDNGKVICYGKSESLDLDSRPEDSNIIADYLGLPIIEEKRGIDSEDIHRQVEEARLDSLADHIVQNQSMFKELLRRLSLGSLLSIYTISDTKEIIKKLVKAAQVPDPELWKREHGMGHLYSDYIGAINPNDLAEAIVENLNYYNGYDNIGVPIIIGEDPSMRQAIAATHGVKAVMNDNGIEVTYINNKHINETVMYVPGTFEFKEEQLPPKFKSFPEQMEELKRKNSRFNSSFNKRKKHGRKK